jgi:hypothetical protein
MRQISAPELQYCHMRKNCNAGPRLKSVRTHAEHSGLHITTSAATFLTTGSGISGDMSSPISQQDITKVTELLRRLYPLKAVQRKRKAKVCLSFMSFVYVPSFRHSLSLLSLLSIFVSYFYKVFQPYVPSSCLLNSHHYLQVSSLILHFLLSFLSSSIYAHFFLSDFREQFSGIPQTLFQQ